jgi:hypothetical protein
MFPAIVPVRGNPLGHIVELGFRFSYRGTTDLSAELSRSCRFFVLTEASKVAGAEHPNVRILIPLTTLDLGMAPPFWTPSNEAERLTSFAFSQAPRSGCKWMGVGRDWRDAGPMSDAHEVSVVAQSFFRGPRPAEPFQHGLRDPGAAGPAHGKTSLTAEDRVLSRDCRKRRRAR